MSKESKKSAITIDGTQYALEDFEQKGHPL